MGFALIIDDDPVSRRCMHFVASSCGYTTSSVSSTAAAVRRLESLPQGAVLLCDYMLGDGVGTDLLALAGKLRPDLKPVLMSATSAAQLMNQQGAIPYPLLTKPVRPQALSRVLAA